MPDPPREHTCTRHVPSDRPSRRGRRRLRASRIFTAVAAAIAISVGTATAAAAVTDDYHPTQVSRDFGASVGGWTDVETHTALPCLVEGLTCLAVDSAYVTSGGAGGDDDGFIRTSVGTTIVGLLDSARVTWTSPTFTYDGAGGDVPDSLFFTMDRRVQAAQLLGVLTDAEYRVVLHDVDEDTNLELLDKQVTNQADLAVDRGRGHRPGRPDHR